MIKPVGKRLIVEVKEKPKQINGILLPETAGQSEKDYIVFKSNSESEIKEGDKVIINRYAGQQIELDEIDKALIIVNEDEVIAIIEQD